VDWTKFASKMLMDYGIAIAGDFRIGNMGFVADPRYVIPTIAALESTLLDFGFPVELGAGVKAAHCVFEETYNFQEI